MKLAFNSRNVLILCILFISIFRLSNLKQKEITWDVFGYYLPLPSTFIYDDPMLNDRAWVEKLNEEKGLSATLYQISTNDNGEPMYFFFLGMSMLYLPFFLIAHLWADLFGFAPDGFSWPYQFFMVLGAIIYTIIGLYYFRKILLHFLKDKIAAVVIVIIVFATNYVHHLTFKNLETVNVLFMLASIIIWKTIRWHGHYKLKDLIHLSISIVLIALVKPSEVIIVLIPLLWNVTSLKGLKEKWSIVFSKRTDFLKAIGIGSLFALPQIIYWIIKTGRPFYDSYKNAGVGLDLLDPHIMESMFSFRKGWLVYTPIMICALIGFYFLYRNKKGVFVPLMAYFILALYIIVSWTEWFYGSAFSNRPLITTYPIMGLCLGYFIIEVSKKRLQLALFALFASLCLFLNQFQWWQLKHGVLDPVLTTKEYYWASFLKTEVDPSWEQLKLVKRPYSAPYIFDDIDNYDLALEYEKMFEKGEEGVHSDSIRTFYPIGSDQQFSPAFQMPFYELTESDHVWLRCTIDLRLNSELNRRMPFIVMTMDYNGVAYGYYAPEIKDIPKVGEWVTFELDFLSPEARRTKDEFKCYIWNADGNRFDIDNFQLSVFERKPLSERLKK